MANLTDLKFYFSGSDWGETGGAIGTGECGGGQNPTGITTLTGVTINSGSGNQEGNGTLTFTYSGKTLKWTPPGGTVGTAIALTADGTYAIQGSGGETLYVSVTYASLPTSNISNTINIANWTENIFPNLTSDETTTGLSRYRCLYAKNEGASTLSAVKLYIHQNTPGQDTILMGLDAAGLNGTAATIANEHTAPAGVTFTSPATLTDGLSIGNLAAGDKRAFWLKNLVPANCDVETLRNTYVIGGSVTF